ncbi:hypothetical protein HMPREF1991_01910 [Hoylesella loescheii DSM 19665 = JCM 12249 = ATCC 15930]|uniref:Uncharacterized protein n=1 Tax=Hoylesella loescheii DSM 19665 = JCM 12249 = ATCC 15930 TaxID=1122985 RepID=A0A069QH41_HOYLO|nr:hypothetical protein HMPREF1991_01910 [Hoylesella loescheii DSM 19665 = JCM 12249 = ATCC 15930]
MFATLPYQQINRYAVGGDIAIRFLSNLSQKATSFIPALAYSYPLVGSLTCLRNVFYCLMAG